MALVRVFLCTYRRPELLRRALKSLLAQSHTDWLCELHNDAPDDDEPRRIMDEIAHGDRRITYCRHERNLGAVATFNLAFAGGPEPFASILEDDNWWEPSLLESLLAALADHPEASLAWSNMRIWNEQTDGSWLDTGRSVWEVDRNAPESITIHPGETLQAVDAIHSQGAMVFRPNQFRSVEVPASSDLAIIESLRERAATGPMILLTKPLANFASTIGSARNENPSRWLQAKLLVATSFFQHVRTSSADLCSLWNSRRAMIPPDTDMFFQLAWALRRPDLVAPARFREWLAFFLRTLRRPASVHRALNFREDHIETWRWLVDQTAHFPVEGRATWLTKRLSPTTAEPSRTHVATGNNP